MRSESKSWRAAVLVAAMAGCAGAGSFTMHTNELSAGHWDGSIGRDGWSRPLSLDLERESGAWRGKVRSLRQGPLMPLKELEVRGDEVRFETERLRFVGHVMGDTLSGTVIDLSAGAPAGEFSVTREGADFFAD